MPLKESAPKCHVLFGLEVRTLRKRRGLSQQELANAAGLTRRHIIRVEKGEVRPTRHLIDKLAPALEIPRGILDRGITDFATAGLAPQVTVVAEGIALIVWSHRLSAVNAAPVFTEACSRTQELGLWKVLLDISEAECYCQDKEQYDEGRKILKWLRRRQYWPLLAVVANSTFDPWGAEVARHQGFPAYLFSSREKALAWLQKTPWVTEWSPNLPLSEEDIARLSCNER